MIGRDHERALTTAASTPAARLTASFHLTHDLNAARGVLQRHQRFGGLPGPWQLGPVARGRIASTKSSGVVAAGS